MYSTPLRFLRVLPEECNLQSVLKSGQSFRWTKSEIIYATEDPTELLPVKEEEEELKFSAREWPKEEFWFGHKDRTVCLRQTGSGIYYRSLFNYSSLSAYKKDLISDSTRTFLHSYLDLNFNLSEAYQLWSRRDPHFRRMIEQQNNYELEGIRILNQDAWEALLCFVCSSNNNIARIGQMVNNLCKSLGAKLPHPKYFNPDSVHTIESLDSQNHSPIASTSKLQPDYIYSFPLPSDLISEETEEFLRELGFGYRSRYVYETSLLLLEKAKEKELHYDDWLHTLTKLELDDAREILLQFLGVGRKVADCVLLFGLQHRDVVPVDTHVFQIAIRDYDFPATKTTSLTTPIHNKVAKKLQTIWGSASGNAQQVLFFSDLASTKSPKKRSLSVTPVKQEKQEEEEDLMNSPTKKRIKSSPVKKEVKFKLEESVDEKKVEKVVIKKEAQVEEVKMKKKKVVKIVKRVVILKK